jgi:putative ABC transport system permease protein
VIGALAQVTLRQWRRHALRAVLATLSIALGVAAFFAICTANDGLNAALRLTVERIAGRATLEVSADEAGIAEGLLDRVRKVPGVDVADPVIEVVARSPFTDGGSLLVLGLDLAGGHHLHDVTADRGSWQPLEFIAQPDSVALTEPLARRHGLGLGSTLVLTLPSGTRTFTVRGLFRPEGLAEVYGGNVAVVDVYAAQDLFARGRSFDRIDVANAPGTDVDLLRARLQAALPAGLAIGRPAARGQQLEDTLAVMRFGLLLSSGVALIVAAYIILNAFTIAVAERRRELGILRAIGVTRLGIVGLVLGEALLTGAAGALLGVAAGQWLALRAARLMASVAAASFGVVTSPPQGAWRADYALGAVVLGLSAAALGAWLPARAAARLDPVVALQNIELRAGEAAFGRLRLVGGLVLLGAGTLFIAASPPRVGTARQLALGAMLLTGIIAVLPALAQLAARSLRPLLDRAGGPAAAIAVDAMISAPRRSAAAVGALVIGTTFVLTTAASIQGYKRLVHAWMDQVINADLIVAASGNARSVSGHFREELGHELAAVPGVGRLESIRYASTTFRGERAALVATDMPELLERAAAAISMPDPVRARGQLLAGRGVLVSRNFAARWDTGPGRTLDLESPSGTLALEVVGLIDDYRSEMGTVFLSRAAYQRSWGDGAVDFFDIRLAAGADPATVRRGVERLVAAAGSGIVYANNDYRRHVGVLIDRYFVLNDAQLVIAVVVALLGIVNTLVVSVAERRREIGVLRALGALRSQVRNQVLVEAGAIGVVGVLIGAAVSLLATLYISRSVAVAVAGYTLPYVVPWALLLAALPVAVAGAMLAGAWPASRAARAGIVEAIADE